MNKFLKVKKRGRESLFFSKLVGLFCLMLLYSTGINAETSQQQGISISLKNAKLKQVFIEIEKTSNYKFVYNSKEKAFDKKMDVSFEDETIRTILDYCLQETDYTYSMDNEYVVLKKKKQEPKAKEKKEVSGKVVDEKGQPLPGVAVVVQGTNIGTATDAKGKFKIKVTSKDALTFTFIGYKDEIVLVKDKLKIEVQMTPKTETLEEVQVTAFGVQKKESVTSSISTVRTEDLKFSSSSDFTQALKGTVPSMFIVQNHGLPGSAMTDKDMSTQMAVRGVTSYQQSATVAPLIILDGIETSMLDFSRLNPEDIESFSVLKDASATAMYGARGANGVIIVTTKKGEAGNVYTTFKCEYIFSENTKDIDVVSPVDYMKLFNEAITTRNPSSKPYYDYEKISRTASGKYPNYVYPANDWHKQLFKDMSVNKHYSLSVRGGTNKLQYYSSLNFNDDEGNLKVDKLNDFDNNINSKTTTFRTNLNVRLNNTGRLVVNSFSTFDKYTGPPIDAVSLYGLAFSSSPVDFAPTYPADELHDWPHIRFGGSETSDNPYAQIQKGYSSRNRFSTMNRAEFIQNLNFLTKGLEFRASASYTRVGYNQKVFEYVPAFYSLASWNQKTNKHVLFPKNEREARRTLEVNGDNSSSYSETQMQYEAKLIHTRKWRNHETGVTILANAVEKSDNIPISVQQSVEQRNMGISAQATYGYKSRYYFEASFGYNGSERFSEKNRMGFFPAVSGAWILSRENFMRSTNSWLNEFKIRLSYGQVGNDGVIKDPRFVFLENIAKLSTGYVTGTSPNAVGNSLYIVNYANPETTWEISEQTNMGFDIKLFNGLLESNIDIYKEVRHNIYSYRTVVPSHVGLTQAPLDNIGKVEAKGFDISAKLQYAFNNDFWFIMNGVVSYNKATYLDIEESPYLKLWQKKEGKEISQVFGYISEGLFRDEAEVRNSPFQSGNVQAGDIKYRDIDNNGTIDINDAVAIGFPQNPRYTYGFNGFLHYKGLEFSFAFQGLAERGFWIDPKKTSPFVNNRALIKAYADNHWTTQNNNVNALWPRLSTKNIIEHNPQEDFYNPNNVNNVRSTFFMRNGSFLRCTSIELGYKLPKEFISKFKLNNFKIFARTNNPFVISDFKLWDVEMGENGFNYPIQRTYSFGLNLSF